MSQFTFIVQVPVNLITTVEANSLEDAVQLVAKQSVQKFCDDCAEAADNKGEWVVCSGVQEAPMEGFLVDCLDSSMGKGIDQTEARGRLRAAARALWG